MGLRFCARASSSCGERGPLFIAVRRPLTVAASLVAEHRLQTRRLSSCGSRAQSLRGMWDLPRPGLEPVSPASAGRFSTTAPPGKAYCFTFVVCFLFGRWQIRKSESLRLNYLWGCASPLLRTCNTLVHASWRFLLRCLVGGQGREGDWKSWLQQGRGKEMREHSLEPSGHWC